MISGIRSTLAGLLGQQKKVEASAQNTANLLTEGYKKTRVTLVEGTSGQVVARSEKIETPGPVIYEQTSEGFTAVELANVELSEEIPGLLLSRRYFQANLKHIRAQDEMLGTLLDIRK